MSSATVERPLASSDPAERRGRWGRGTAIGAVVVAVLGSGVLYLARYQPLVTADAGWTSPAYQQDGPFSYAFGMKNRGPLPITVTGVGPWPRAGLLRTTAVLISRSGAPAPIGDIAPRLYEPFHAFSLGAGQWRGILIQSVFDGCTGHAPGVGSGAAAVRVRFKVLGMPRDARVPLAAPIVITSPTFCPGRG